MSDLVTRQMDLVLPVSGKAGKMRYATRMDRIYAQAQIGAMKGPEADDKFELAYIGRIISELDGVKGPFEYEQLKTFPEKDLVYLRVCDSKMNSLSDDDIKGIVENFDKALKP